MAGDAAETHPTPHDMPIPNRLNMALVIFVFCAAVGLLWLASQTRQWYELLGVGIVFSYLLLTNYALLHEAAHGNLQSGRRRNYWFGILTGMLFPIPFSLIRCTHRNHHQNNRTNAEMFDLYYPHDNVVMKYIQWYGILLGLFWPLVPFGAVVISLAPRSLLKRSLGKSHTTGYLFANVRDVSVWRVRLETAGIVAFFVALHWLFGLHWVNTLVLYACFSFNWSTRQYIAHAFTKRDVIEGAWNLRHNWLMSWVLLHGEYDLTHHRHPEVSWIYLPRLTPPDEPRLSYFKQYWRQWLGPRPVAEPAPVPTPRQWAIQ
jgi:fatty acid desaturase